MELLIIITMLALLQFVYFGAKVGAARTKYSIEAPATTGHEIFERHYRIHYNTLEQLITFLPSLWAFGFYVSYLVATIFGAIYLIGRLIYANAYLKAPKSRTLGGVLSALPGMIMAIGALIGVALSYF